MPYYTCGDCGRTSYSASDPQYLKDPRCPYCGHPDWGVPKRKKRHPDYFIIWIVSMMFVVLIFFDGWARRELKRIDNDLISIRQDLTEMQSRAKADKLSGAVK